MKVMLYVKKQLQNTGSSTYKPVGMVTMGIGYDPICVPNRSSFTFLGKISMLTKRKLYTIEMAAHNNLPSGIVVNHPNITPNAWYLSVILINNTQRSIQPLLTAEIS